MARLFKRQSAQSPGKEADRDPVGAIGFSTSTFERLGDVSRGLVDMVGHVTGWRWRRIFDAVRGNFCRNIKQPPKREAVLFYDLRKATFQGM